MLRTLTWFTYVHSSLSVYMQLHNLHMYVSSVAMVYSYL